MIYKKNYLLPVILLSFIIALLLSGILLGVAINILYGKFSLTLLKIALINSIFFSLGIMLNIILSRYLYNKIRHFYLFLLSILLIFGVSFMGFTYIFFTEMFFFLYETYIVYSYMIINFIFIICISIIITGVTVYQNSLSEKENIIIEEKYLRSQTEKKLYISKINPHFLFNSLNLMISLLKKPKKAEKALMSLSDLLRYNLEASEKELITINNEINNAEKYLYIQKLRFEDRFNYSINCNSNFLIPPLILQPLIENSIKHNIKNTDSLEITIEIFRKKNSNIIKIYDSEKLLNNKMLDKGTGLTYTKKRVELTGGKFIIENGGIIITYFK